MELRFRKSSLAGVLLVGVLMGSGQETKPAPPTPIDQKKAELGGTPWDAQWDTIVEQALPPEMLSTRVPRGVVRFCPRFYAMVETDKRAFWAYFFQALAGAEAGLNPTSTVRQVSPEAAARDSVPKDDVRTEGLLQLAYADAKRYGCDFDWEADRAKKAKDPSKTILQPKNNLECGIKILFDQLMVKHRPLLTQSSYWSTLRPGASGYSVFIKQMTNPPAACALPVKTSIDKAATTKTVQDGAARTEAPK
jgi:hypothetical protein